MLLSGSRSQLKIRHDQKSFGVWKQQWCFFIFQGNAGGAVGCPALHCPHSKQQCSLVRARRAFRRAGVAMSAPVLLPCCSSFLPPVACGGGLGNMAQTCLCAEPSESRADSKKWSWMTYWGCGMENRSRSIGHG